MAGAILVNDIDGVSMSGVEFDHIAEAIREPLKKLNQRAMENTYRSLDEEGMEFISLEHLDGDAFKNFFDAASGAYEREKKERPDSPFKNAWSELLRLLLADPRLGR